MRRAIRDCSELLSTPRIALEVREFSTKVLDSLSLECIGKVRYLQKVLAKKKCLPKAKLLESYSSHEIWWILSVGGIVFLASEHFVLSLEYAILVC